MNTLLPLYAHPLADPGAWILAAGAGRDGREVTIVVNIQDGPDRVPAGSDRDPVYAATTDHLATAGVPMLGYVDLGYATRAVADIVDDVARWADYPVDGVFFDQAPTSPFSIGPVALAIRVARRAGVGGRIVLNPGLPTDSLYRDLGTEIVVYEGTWADYKRWSADGSRPGDGHLVYGVPAAQFAKAERLLDERGAAFGLVTDLDAPAPYEGVPAWCGGMAPVG
jgi:Spherulation-specific family 4